MCLEAASSLRRRPAEEVGVAEVLVVEMAVLVWVVVDLLIWGLGLGWGWDWGRRVF